MDLSLVIPVYNEEESIQELTDWIVRVCSSYIISFEIIFVDDGSTDDSDRVIAELSQKDRRVIGLSHSRNFGSQVAYRSGLEMASKNACLLMDGSRDSAEAIPAFLQKNLRSTSASSLKTC